MPSRATRSRGATPAPRSARVVWNTQDATQLRCTSSAIPAPRRRRRLRHPQRTEWAAALRFFRGHPPLVGNPCCRRARTHSRAAPGRRARETRHRALPSRHPRIEGSPRRSNDPAQRRTSELNGLDIIFRRSLEGALKCAFRHLRRELLTSVAYFMVLCRLS